MRSRSVIPLLTILSLATGLAQGSPRIDLSTEELQMLRTDATRSVVEAQDLLGTLYAEGRGVPQDYSKARQWWEKAAQQGSPTAQNDLGLLYVNGQGVPKNYTRARQWFEKAAAQGNAEGQNNLGTLCANGQGVPQDYSKARQWYEKAAAQGHASAQINLGVIYADGQGVPKDYVRAYMWWSLALAHSTGDEQYLAANNLEAIAERMSPAQIADAQRLATEWKPKSK